MQAYPLNNITTVNIKIFSDDHCKIEANCVTMKENGIKLSHSQDRIKYIGETSLSNNNLLSSNNNESLNFSKTASISNMSVQTMRISNNNINDLSSSNKAIFIQEADISSQSDQDLVEQGQTSRSVSNNNTSIIHNPNRREKPSETKSIFCTPSTICNYFQHSNEVTPNKPRHPGSKNNFKLNLKNINLPSNNQLFSSRSEENINENVSSSSRNHQVFTIKSNLMYTKPQLKSGDKNSNANLSGSSRGVPSPFVNALKINSKTIDETLSALAKDFKKNFEISDMKTNLNNDFDLEIKANGADFAQGLDRKNLNSTFEKIVTDVVIEAPKKNENFSFDITKKKHSDVKEDLIEKLNIDLNKHNLHPNIKGLLNKNSNNVANSAKNNLVKFNKNISLNQTKRSPDIVSVDRNKPKINSGYSELKKNLNTVFGSNKTSPKASSGSANRNYITTTMPSSTKSQKNRTNINNEEISIFPNQNLIKDKTKKIIDQHNSIFAINKNDYKKSPRVQSAQNENKTKSIKIAKLSKNNMSSNLKQLSPPVDSNRNKRFNNFIMPMKSTTSSKISFISNKSSINNTRSVSRGSISKTIEYICNDEQNTIKKEINGIRNINNYNYTPEPAPFNNGINILTSPPANIEIKNQTATMNFECNTNIVKAKKNQKVIENFSNYKKVNNFEDKENIQKLNNLINNSIIHNNINDLSIVSNHEICIFGHRSFANSIIGNNTKKQIVSSKLLKVAGDDDDIDIEE